MISTICIRGLPDDMKRRELRNLVAFIPGFETVSLSRGEGTKPTTGFARFSSPAEAQNAQYLLDRYHFDEEVPVERARLQVEIARRDLDDNPRHGGSSSAPPRRPPEPQRMGPPMGGPPPPVHGGYNNYPPPRDSYAYPPPRDNYPPPSGYAPRGGYPPPRDSYPPLRETYPPRDYPPRDYPPREPYLPRESYPPRDYAPRDYAQPERKRSRYDGGENRNDTICIRMIPEGCAEESVKGLFENFDGYKGHKLLNNASNAQTLMCFVLFEEAKNAQQAISLLQGQELMSASGSKSEITIEMARRSLQLDDVR
mmetsp:Transcript_60880/g.161019  ORF Transcript_60880/g.161019 Transcript_60880/m.161019 type:complete len:311 (+) Transcript_60880:59-991(+)